MRPVPNPPCLDLIHAFEGKGGSFEPTRTQDPVGNWEIGWSHKLSGPDDPLWDATVDLAKSNDLALAALDVAGSNVCAAISDGVAAELTEGQYAALVDFTYNVGPHNFAGSTLCRLVRTGNLTLAYNEFPKWVYGHEDGKPVVLPGLVRRRAAEQKCWIT